MIYVNIIGLAILGIFSLFVVSKKDKILSDYILLLTIFLFSGILITSILISNNITLGSYISFLFFNSFIFPVLVIYGLSLLNSGQKFSSKWLWTASYAIAFIAFIILDTLFITKYDTPEMMSDLVRNVSPFYNVLYKGQYIFVVSILIWLIRKLNNFQSNIKNYYSSIETIHLKWFKNFAYIYLFVNVASLLLFILLDLRIVSDISIPLFVEHLILVLSLFYLCFHGIRQYNLASFNPSVVSDEKNRDAAKEKYGTSSLSIEEMNSLFEQIESLFTDDTIYLEPELKIETLANRLEVGNHKISQTINTVAKQSFYDYVNKYRVTYLKKLLKSEKHQKYTILAMGIESGFNSKSSLNRIFKQQVGMSPLSYQKTQIVI
ncbi:helix-turn-helix domain-containing protein [Maribacter sp. HTCC2170]|uniref:helix-turn-helix domain-containing protein n=1 Tax=Maribacter sp. (strain HTCC2170 / KCCM 42371) TaxID=313603 RepID=UPI00006AFCAF|nr:helix-turn-helix domain-containing protein [Maribacter sp. HTCC2170]EAR01392.1 transcriptional regulator [Maribacter sp. HTCC2170]